MKNGLFLPGQTNGYLLLSPLSVDQSGDYSVPVTAETGYGPGQDVLSQTAKVRIVPLGQLLLKIGIVNGAFQWIISPPDASVFTASDLANLQVLASTDLVDWQPLANVLHLENGAIKILDPDAATLSHRFLDSKLLSGSLSPADSRRSPPHERTNGLESRILDWSHWPCRHHCGGGHDGVGLRAYPVRTGRSVWVVAWGYLEQHKFSACRGCL